MREALFILLVIIGLIALSAFRYRKQIAGMIGFARMLKEAKQSISETKRQTTPENAKNTALVNCSKCGVWVPQNKARKVGDIFYCSDECLRSSR